MTTKQRTKRTSAGTRQIEKLYLDLLDALYAREDIPKARRIANRLELAVSDNQKFAGSILLDEVRSLVAEARGDLSEAIRCREREIRKILELHNISADTPARDYVVRHYDHSDVSDRLDLLAILYADQGDLGQAIETLKDSKSYCAAHEVPFDGEDLVADLMAQTKANSARNGQRGK